MTTVAPDTRTRTSFVYAFDEPAPGGRELLGGKGLGLAEMAHLGVPVPAGFTITTDACRAYLTAGGELPGGLEDEIAEHIERLERATGASVRRSDRTRCSSRSARARRSRCRG